MKRKVTYMGGYSSILLDVKKRKIYHYEKDTLAVHKEYGGEFYYESRSGYTGEGYITSSTPLFCSSYRIDCRQEVNFEKPLLNNGGVELQIFAPIKGHEKAWDSFPFVIRIVLDNNYDNNILIFIYASDLFYFLREILQPVDNLKQHIQKYIEKQNIKTIEYDILDPKYFCPKKITIDVINHRLGIGLNYLNFLDLREYKPNFSSYEVIYEITDIREMGHKYVLLDSNGLVIDYFEENPILFPPHMEKICKRKGWEYQKRNNCNVLIQPKKGKIKITVYQDVEKIYEYYQLNVENMYGTSILEYEETFPIIIYNCHPDNCIRQVIKGLKNKMKQDIKYEIEQRKKVEDLLEFINNNPDKVVTIEDSIAAGNCRFGTENFRDEYFPGREEVTLKDLEPYINKYDVQRVVRYIMTK
jgi:hypothetical protein